ncbi:MAG: helix-turn-helix domain-containing protein [Rhodanobacteraceae bacterium]
MWLANGYNSRRTPYGIAVAIENVDGLHRAIGRCLATEKPKLTGREFRFLRKELGLSQAAFAAAVGKDAQTVALWEKGKTRLPVWADRVMRKLYLEAVGGNEKLRDLLDRLTNQDEQQREAKWIFEERPRKGWSTAVPRKAA